jgi:acetyl esterase/lipase
MIKRIVFLLVGLAMALGVFAACAPVTLLNGITPSGSFDRTKNISFGPDARHTLDVYAPDTAAPKAPVLVFVHGGGWNSGSKDMYKFLAESFTKDGYRVIVPNYRLHPNSVFPDPVTDTAKAAAWSAKQYPDTPLVLMGHSAGAYNVLMTGLTDAYLKAEGIDRCRHISGIISLAGPVGTIPLTEEPYITVFPDRFTTTDAPLNIVSEPAPPLFLANGDNDTSVYPQNATMLAEKVTARGGKAEARIYAGHNHTDVVKFLSRYFDEDSTLKADVLTFIEALPVRGAYCH